MSFLIARVLTFATASRPGFPSVKADEIVRLFMRKVPFGSLVALDVHAHILDIIDDPEMSPHGGLTQAECQLVLAAAAEFTRLFHIRASRYLLHFCHGTGKPFYPTLDEFQTVFLEDALEVLVDLDATYSGVFTRSFYFAHIATVLTNMDGFDALLRLSLSPKRHSVGMPAPDAAMIVDTPLGTDCVEFGGSGGKKANEIAGNIPRRPCLRRIITCR